MTKKLTLLALFGVVFGMNPILSGAAEIENTPFSGGLRFSCAFQGPAACTAFGELENAASSVINGNDHLTIICGNAVLYSEGVYITLPTNSSAELRSILPGAAEITIKALGPNFFTGSLPAVLRIPAAPGPLVSGVCHLNFPSPTPLASELTYDSSAP